MGLYGIVYKATNLINGRVYIGLTTTTLERRWAVHCCEVRRGSKYLFHKAIRKYGEDSFSLEIIASEN